MFITVFLKFCLVQKYATLKEICCIIEILSICLRNTNLQSNLSWWNGTVKIIEISVYALLISINFYMSYYTKI